MANDITQNPWVLDTVADNIVAPGTGKKIKPKLIIYSGADTAGDTAQIEDGNEVVKFLLSVAAVGETVVVPIPAGADFEMDGLSLGALGGGKVYIYF